MSFIARICTLVVTMALAVTVVIVIRGVLGTKRLLATAHRDLRFGLQFLAQPWMSPR